jgi:hypothetical protein
MLITVLLATSAWPAGLWIYETGAPDLGTAVAGRVQGKYQTNHIRFIALNLTWSL